MMKVKFDMIGIFVEDLSRMVHFYKEVIGIEIYAPRNEFWKMRSSMIADPEGNLIEIGSDFWE